MCIMFYLTIFMVSETGIIVLRQLFQLLGSVSVSGCNFQRLHLPVMLRVSENFHSVMLMVTTIDKIYNRWYRSSQLYLTEFQVDETYCRLHLASTVYAVGGNLDPRYFQALVLIVDGTIRWRHLLLMLLIIDGTYRRFYLLSTPLTAYGIYRWRYYLMTAFTFYVTNHWWHLPPMVLTADGIYCWRYLPSMLLSIDDSYH